MPREKEDYRNTIEQLNRQVPERELLTQEEVQRITGWSRNTVKKYVPMVNGRINKATLARVLCP